MPNPRPYSDVGYGDYTPPGYPRPQGGVIPQSNQPGDLYNLDAGASLEDAAQRPMDPSNRRRNQAANTIGKVGGNRQQPGEDEILALLQQFYDQFNSPLDYNDPFVRSILQNAEASTTQRAGNAGIFGPYSQNLAQQAYIKSAAGLQGEKQRMAGQALGMLTGYKTDKRNFDYNKAKDSYQAALDQWKTQGDRNQDLWKMVGGGLGAVVGGVGGAVAGGGPLSLPGAAAGATAGWNLGQQAGGAVSDFFGGGSNQVPQWSQYQPRGGGY